MKKLLALSYLLFVTAPVVFVSELVSQEQQEEFNVDDLALALEEADLGGHEFVKPPSRVAVFFRRIFSPIGVAFIKMCDSIRTSWHNVVGTRAKKR